MNVIDVLLESDPVIRRLTQRHLLDHDVELSTEGYIDRYLDLYDPINHMWGGGVYGPKWISTHYTMLELKYMEIDPMHQIYQDALQTLLEHEWKNHGLYNRHVHQDMCVVGMLLSLACYGKSQDPKIAEMIDYILDHTMPDGGWNCAWERKPSPKISSVHTTLSVLEALHDVDQYGYTYRIKEVRMHMLSGIECLLKRNLYQAHGTKEAIHPSMAKASYPPRWKYDILRALEFLASVKYPDSLRLTDAINTLISQMKGPFMPKGSQISGLLHFKLEEGRYGMFNTLRMLKVLKHFRFPLYQKLIQQEV